MKNEKFNNGLSDAELERLAILSEECAEVQQIVGKILRHGYASCNPFDKDKTMNRKLLEKEIGDINLAIELLTKARDISAAKIAYAQIDKREKIKPYLHHQS